MRIVYWTAANLILLLFCLADARLDFWRSNDNHEAEHKGNRVNDVNPNKFSPVIFSK